MNDNFGAKGSLSAYKRRADGLYVHGGLVGSMEKFSEGARTTAENLYATALHALHLDAEGSELHSRLIASGMHPHDAAAMVPEKNIKGAYHLGSGMVTNLGVMALANDFAWASGYNTLRVANYHISGNVTGNPTAAATDFQLGAVVSSPGPAAGTQSLITAPYNSSTNQSQKYQTVGVLSYASTLAITEWGLLTGSTLTTAGTFTSTSATGGSVSGTPYTASSATVQGLQQNIVYASVAGSVGLITSNTSSSIVVPAWYAAATGLAGTTPGSTATFTIQPLMWDHKIFSQINVVSGDSIQFTYQLTCASGG